MINGHSYLLKITFNINLDDANKQFPHMYWLSKLHKTPSEAKFITAFANCSLGSLLCFENVFKQIEAFKC